MYDIIYDIIKELIEKKIKNLYKLSKCRIQILIIFNKTMIKKLLITKEMY